MFLKAGIFTFLMGMALLSQAQEPAVGNRVASSQIRVRIPSYAIIQLAKNSSTKVSVNALSDLEKKTVLRKPAQGAIISNQKWILYVEVQPTLPAKQQQGKPDSTDTQIIYTTSPK